jgi:hypothetical protein
MARLRIVGSIYPPSTIVLIYVPALIIIVRTEEEIDIM